MCLPGDDIVEQDSDNTADDGPKDGDDQTVFEVAGALTLDGENGVRNTRTEVTRRVQRIAGQAAARLAAEGLRPDVIMLDPPRKGCDETTLSAVVQMSPRRVVYVSCNPETMARDLALLTAKGYRAEGFTPVDLFPQTAHCEVVGALTRSQKSKG